MNAELDIHHHVAQLTRRHTVQTAYTTLRGTDLATAYHYTQAPALLTQLEHSSPSSSADARGAAGFGSRPAARLEALDTLMHIDKQSSAWIRRLGHDDPGSTIACVIRLGSLYPSAGDRDQTAIARDVRSWYNQARITTGYDSPAWRPDNTCPLCNEKGSLRVKLADRTALCIGCWETWDGITIGLLADHIRDENREDEAEEMTPDEAA